jgi:hypothetical protein
MNGADFERKGHAAKEIQKETHDIQKEAAPPGPKNEAS